MEEKIDPFTVEIIKKSLKVAAEEMFYAFGRTAKSPVIYEVLDFAVGLTNANGDLIAQAHGVPGFTGVLDYAARKVIDKWDGELSPGDVIVDNVPYESGTHLNDTTLSMPVFHKDELVALIVNKGHWSEIGGMHFGSWTPDATEIYQEGLQLPCIKLFHEGKADEDLITLIKTNSRLPAHTEGDLRAQAASMRVARKRIHHLIEKYGYQKVRYSMQKLLEDGKEYARLKLESVPKGEFKAVDYIDDDGITDDPLKIQVKVTISDEEFIADFTGSSEQGEGSLNSAFPATVSGVRVTYMGVTDPHMDPNGGFFSPIDVIAPEGTVFHPTPPAPTSTFWEATSFASDLVWKALAPHVPEKLSAGHFLSILATILGGTDDKTGEAFSIVEPQPGGWGACYNRDGESGLVACVDGETYIAPVEIYERNMPIMVDRYELNTEDGTGHGTYRGGFGVIRDYRVLNSKANLSLSIGRSKYPPWGVKEGQHGSPNYAIVFKKGEEPRKVRKCSALEMERGDVVSIRPGSGGGWGPSVERDIELIKRDVKNDYITAKTAREVYGVAIDPDTLEIDEDKTKRLREKLRMNQSKTA
ncbi:MAG: hydantoinase B/oxoprolinase family protein [Candidatus Korarchaeota archaeon]|nr:hydantoinase B/oxoprolinase family protein [Candidatus Korarchaeota archaeon]NIU83644.1 5-oxoprolinase [Candidatus Thorarchaeota archaeon]NIW13871.1 5-oxoprolinase [Candidatus Thorarchaeota archaeon]NIW51982.1 5-oxoprolinase [Candidatus Korarchaeota archaeon]